MFRFRPRSLLGIALAVTASCSSSGPATGPNATPPPSTPDPTPTRPQPGSEQTAVSFGMTVEARDERTGAPRLVRSIVPRQTLARGMAPDQAAREHLAAIKSLWLARENPAELASTSVQQLRNGGSIVRLQQQIDKIPVYQGELRVMLHPDGALAAVSGTLLPSTARTSFKATPAAAVEIALDTLYGASRARPTITVTGESSGYIQLAVAASPQFVVQTVRAKRELLADGDQPYPIWNLEVFAEKLGDDHQSVARRFLISDIDGKVVRDVNLTASDTFVYRVPAETTGNRTPFDNPLTDFSPHPTDGPDGSLPAGFGPYNLVVQDAFNRPHDPWLGVMATTTTGNNVDAYADINPPSGFSAGDIRPEVRAGRVLNHIYDFTAEPLSTVEQSKAAAVNVFYVTNWMHDWWYDSGFTEATGNAQADNFGRGGIGGDPLVAHAQSNANVGSRDNAFMTTPADGLSPTMDMFLFSGRLEASLTTPTATPATDVFVAGPHNFDLDGIVVLAVNTSDGLHNACTPINDVTGKIALFDLDPNRCDYPIAQANAKAAGAVGVIGIGFLLEPPIGSADANIPGLVIGDDDGVALKAQLPAFVRMHRRTHLETDGDLDATVIAHEWGHYLHQRLAVCDDDTGEANPHNLQCLAMSEGWGDFNALMMMLREGDNREGTFPMAMYALTAGGLVQRNSFPDTGYFGFRRFPYSTSKAHNGLTFKHIGKDNALPDMPANPLPSPNNEAHNAGEVWAESLWEVYNVLIDAHGVAESHRRMSDYIVAGLLLTPPSATFTEARDAILAAVSGIDTDDMLLMAAAWAGRGLGSCAVAPPRTSRDFTGVVESGTIAARIETSAATVTDDDVSCDHDGHLDPGESGTIRITLSNSGLLAANSVVVKPTTTTSGVTIGSAIAVGTIAPSTAVEIAIPVRVALTAPVNADLDIAIEVDGDAGCNTSKLNLVIHQKMGVDDAAAVATTDDLENRIFAWTPTGERGSDVWSRAAGADGNHVIFGAADIRISDTQLVSPVLQVSPTAPLVVSFKHSYRLPNIQPSIVFGAVIELSNDGGASWRDVTELGVDPGYTGPIRRTTLAGRNVFLGDSLNFPALKPVTLNFGAQLAGQAVQLRFRLVSCCANVVLPNSGWTIDDVAVSGITNTPFPLAVPEPIKCTAGTVANEVEDTVVTAVRKTPHVTLAGVPGVSQ